MAATASSMANQPGETNPVTLMRSSQPRTVCGAGKTVKHLRKCSRLGHPCGCLQKGKTVSHLEPGGPLPPDVLQDAAATFGMLSATARLHILWLLAEGERDVGTLAAEVGQSVATVSHHLAKLKLAGLVRSRKEGRHQVYLIDDPRLVEIVRLTVNRREDRGRGGRRARGA